MFYIINIQPYSHVIKKIQKKEMRPDVTSLSLQEEGNQKKKKKFIINLRIGKSSTVVSAIKSAHNNRFCEGYSEWLM